MWRGFGREDELLLPRFANRSATYVAIHTKRKTIRSHEGTWRKKPSDFPSATFPLVFYRLCAYAAVQRAIVLLEVAQETNRFSV